MVGHFMLLRSELIVSILTEWLPLKSTTLVDSALCSHCYREIWLQTLKCWCILPIVSLQLQKWRSLLNWLCSRSIRAKKLELYSMGMYDLCQCAILSKWLSTTANAVRSVTFLNDCSAFVPTILQHCTQLRELEVNNFRGFSFWNIVRNNPSLAVLKLKETHGKIFNAPSSTLQSVLELTICVDSVMLRYFLSHMSALTHLVLLGTPKNLPSLASCARLISLNLRDTHLTEDQLVQLVSSLPVGLRKFVFPFVEEQPKRQKGYYRNRALLAVWPLHAQSLECLEICYRMDWRIAELINSCVVLHTLVIRTSCHKSSWPAPNISKVLNPSIRTLHIDNCDASTFATIKANFSNVTTLGFMNTDRNLVCEHVRGILSACNKVLLVYTDFCVPMELRKRKQLMVYKTYLTRNLF